MPDSGCSACQGMNPNKKKQKKKKKKTYDPLIDTTIKFCFLSISGNTVLSVTSWYILFFLKAYADLNYKKHFVNYGKSYFLPYVLLDKVCLLGGTTNCR